MWNGLLSFLETLFKLLFVKKVHEAGKDSVRKEQEENDNEALSDRVKADESLSDDEYRRRLRRAARGQSTE